MAHRFVLARLLVLVALVTLAACGGGAASGDFDKLQVTLSQFAVSVTNTSGQILTEVVAEIEPAGPASHFKTRPETMGSGETRTLAHSNFTDGDSVPFSPRTAKARKVTVTAKDASGAPLKVELPFKS
jgi:ABC-type glycerol-3-phosphate transport system substrate-binding protein